MINNYEKEDRKIYKKNPAICIDCNKKLDFTIRANKRCPSCYKIERKRKDIMIIPKYSW
jgi:hypothetical protein